MKMHISWAIAPAVALVVALTGCSFVEKIMPHREKVNPVLPQDRENLIAKKSQQTYTPEELKSGVVKGDWAIETVFGKDAVGEKAPFIKFAPSERRIYGNNGCNVINGAYTYNPKDSTINFSDVASTMMLCHKEGLTDYEINTALQSTKYYTWKMQDGDYYLTFFNESGRPVMTLMHQNFEFLNGTWRVAKIDGKEVNVPGMKLVVDIDEGKLHGNTGCNIINGEVEIDMDRPNSVSFSAIAITRMLCPDNEHETSMIVALEEVSAARPVSGNEVVLYDDSHREVLTLVRASDKD